MTSRARARLSSLGTRLRRSRHERRLDREDRAARKRDPLLPPRRLRDRVGWGDFHGTGRMFADAFVTLAEIGPQERILDLGCGCARLAIPLMDHLSGTGAYEGLDVMAEAIDWASAAITPRAPRFRFQVADVRNASYNPEGSTAAADYRFPYPDAAFDVALANSLFTHMLPDDVTNYLGELQRVLRPGGRAVVTYFLMDEATRALVEAGRASIDMRHHVPPYWTATPDRPERALGYEESYVRDLHERAGLPIRSLSHGGWRDGSEGALFQDVVLADRP